MIFAKHVDYHRFSNIKGETMTFGELTTYILEMQGLIPEDAEVIMETNCQSEWGTVWWSIDHARYNKRKVILSEIEK